MLRLHSRSLRRILPLLRPINHYRHLSQSLQAMADSAEIDIESLQANYRDILQRVAAASEEAGTQHVSGAPGLCAMLFLLCMRLSYRCRQHS
jgi:hypothetical protein